VKEVSNMLIQIVNKVLLSLPFLPLCHPWASTVTSLWCPSTSLRSVEDMHIGSPRLSFLRRQEPSQAFDTKTVFYYLYKTIFFLNVSLGSCLRRNDKRGGVLKFNDQTNLNSHCAGNDKVVKVKE
jgi:hypothetical protein